MPEPVRERMMNPDLQKWYGSTSNINKVTAISVPLHFLFELDENGRGCMRTKITARQERWSEPFYPLKCENNSLEGPDDEHMLKLGNIAMFVKPQKVLYS